MVTIKSCLWTSLLIALFTLSALGCASSGTPKAIGPNDLPSLAGKWTGTLILPSGRSAPGTFDMSPNGEYVVQASGFTARGKAQVKDGNLMLAATTTTGMPATGPLSSVASLSERPDGMLLLRGNGHSDSGPFSYEVTRKK